MPANSDGFTDVQDELFMAYPEELDSAHTFLQRVLGKDPSPAAVVSRFRYCYPDLYYKVRPSERRKSDEDNHH